MELEKTQIQSDIIEILKDTIQDWGIDVDDINPKTKLVEDLGFVSVDLNHLVLSIEEHFKQRLGFHELLMQDGKYVDDLSVDELASFVSSQINV